jgi:hypothetical protein
MTARKNIVSDGFNSDECKVFIELINSRVAAGDVDVCGSLLDPFDPLTTGLDKLKAFQRMKKMRAEDGEEDE